MKKIAVFIFIIACLANHSFGQDQKYHFFIDPNTKLITYQEVVQEQGTQDELFNRCVYWLNEFYTNPVDVTRVRDQVSGVIKGQHRIQIYYTDDKGIKNNAGMVLYDFKVEMKENRYRYTVSDFVLIQATRFPAEKWLNKNDPNYNERWEEYLKEIDDFVYGQMIPSLKKKMQPEIKVEEEEW